MLQSKEQVYRPPSSNDAAAVAVAVTVAVCVVTDVVVVVAADENVAFVAVLKWYIVAVTTIARCFC